jgi:molybdopterin molybdotransferase
MLEKYDIGFEDALSRTIGCLFPLAAVDLPVDQTCGLVSADDILAVVDCPSTTVSLRDGYAVVSADATGASRDQPTRLKVVGMAVAGEERDLSVEEGSTVKVMTGANIPRGANAVVAEEFAQEENGWVTFFRDAPPGQNILVRGSDVTKGNALALRGDVLAPAVTGLLAAGGIHTVRVHPLPRVGIISTGDEVVAPGHPLKPGQLYASNLVTLLSWLRHFRIEAEATVVPDRKEKIRDAIEVMLKKADALLTSGGAWKSERDVTARIVGEMGGETVFHRVRLGPGKAVGLMVVAGKPVFCLPGGPPSNEMAFLQIALPGLLRMAGRRPIPFESRSACLTAPVAGESSWTQFLQARLEQDQGQWLAHPLRPRSRLQAQAGAEGLIKIPEGVERLESGEEAEIQVLRRSGKV